MSASQRDRSSPQGVKGGFDGHSVLDQGGGPAGSSNVPTATHTPVKWAAGVGPAAGAGSGDVHDDTTSTLASTKARGSMAPIVGEAAGPPRRRRTRRNPAHRNR